MPEISQFLRVQHPAWNLGPLPLFHPDQRVENSTLQVDQRYGVEVGTGGRYFDLKQGAGWGQKYGKLDLSGAGLTGMWSHRNRDACCFPSPPPSGKHVENCGPLPPSRPLMPLPRTRGGLPTCRQPLSGLQDRGLGSGGKATAVGESSPTHSFQGPKIVKTSILSPFPASAF